MNRVAESYPGERLSQIREAKQRFSDTLLSIPEVNALGIGYRTAAGSVTSELALVVCVDRKLPKDLIPPHHLVPRELRFRSSRNAVEIAVATDVQEMSRLVPNDHVATSTLSAESRPAPGGVSIGTTGAGGGGAGTLGGWVWDSLAKRVVLLSNKHVLGSGPDYVFQPHLGEGGDPNNPLAKWTRASTSWDAAIATPLKASDAKWEIVGLGRAVWAMTQPELGMAVEKTGRATGHTKGVVDLVDFDASKFGGSKSDIRIAPEAPATKFSFPMDSGSVIMEQGPPPGSTWRRAVGLLWGSTTDYKYSVAHPLKSVFADLQLQTLVGLLVWIFSKWWPYFGAKLGKEAFSKEVWTAEPLISHSRLEQIEEAAADAIREVTGVSLEPEVIIRLLREEPPAKAAIAEEPDRQRLLATLQSFIRDEGGLEV